MRKSSGVIAGAVLVLLLAAPVYGQTAGTKIPGADVNRETWTITIAISDSVSTYFTLPLNVDEVILHIPTLTAGGISFEAAIDSSRVSGGRINSVFQPVQTKAAVLDSIVSTAGNLTFNATDICKGLLAVRLHVGPNSVVVQAAARTIRVFITKKPPGL